MSDVITVKIKDFTDWIKAQPDERPVDMDNNYLNDRCGCAMIQYYQDVLKIKGKNIGCGLACWQSDCGGLSKGRTFALFEGLSIDKNGRIENDSGEELGVFAMFENLDFSVKTTFGELKKYL